MSTNSKMRCALHFLGQNHAFSTWTRHSDWMILSEVANRFCVKQFTVLYPGGRKVSTVDCIQRLISTRARMFRIAPRPPSRAIRFRGTLMREVITRMRQSMPFLGRAVEAWPYVFIGVSVAGLVYIALKTGR